MKQKIDIRATGYQAPYGIDETIRTFPASARGLRQAIKFARTKYYNHPNIVITRELWKSLRAEINEWLDDHGYQPIDETESSLYYQRDADNVTLAC